MQKSAIPLYYSAFFAGAKESRITTSHGSIMFSMSPPSILRTVALAISRPRFKQKVYPGDVLMLETKIGKVKGPIGVGEAVATVNGTVVCKAELTFAIGT